MQEALDSFTRYGAEASFEESVKGKIAPGYLADFVILAESPFAVPPCHIHQISVIACYLGGKCVYRA